MKKPTVGIVCGGFTSESEISKKSGQMVFKTLSREFWEVYLIVIRPEKWSVFDDENGEYLFSKGDFTFEKKGKKVSIDVVFNAVHGSPGEDGQLAALFQLLKIPHSSCDVYSAALTYNKRDCLAVLREYDIPMARSYFFDAKDVLNETLIINRVGLPCFVKANRAGSSFGVYKVKEKAALGKAINNALKEDTQLIIESALEGREVSVGALEWEGEIKVLPITEIVTENEFFDYAAKYEGKANEITPAQLPLEMEQAVCATIKKIYSKLGLKGITRSEFIFVFGIPHLLEINTVPGLTKKSIVPQQVEAAGISLSDFFDGLLKTALNIKE